MKLKPLTAEEVNGTLNKLAAWKVVDNALCRTFEHERFSAAILFVAAVAQLAEQHDHHPDIDIRYTKVTLKLSTHDVGGKISDRDVRLALRIDELIASR